MNLTNLRRRSPSEGGVPEEGVLAKGPRPTENGVGGGGEADGAVGWMGVGCDENDSAIGERILMA